MSTPEILQQRLHNLQLNETTFTKPAQLVHWLCGVQAQDYAQAKHAIAMRLPGATDETIEEAIANRNVVRSWVFRGTLHFVNPKDIRWLLDLLAPKVIQAFSSLNKQMGLTDALFKKSNTILTKALKGCKQLTP